MSTPAAAATNPIDRLRARFHRLALDPRVTLLAEGRAIVAELAALVEVIDALQRRTAALERALASTLPPAEDFTNDG